MVLAQRSRGLEVVRDYTEVRSGPETFYKDAIVRLDLHAVYNGNKAAVVDGGRVMIIAEQDEFSPTFTFPSYRMFGRIPALQVDQSAVLSSRDYFGFLVEAQRRHGLYLVVSSEVRQKVLREAVGIDLSREIGDLFWFDGDTNKGVWNSKDRAVRLLENSLIRELRH